MYNGEKENEKGGTEVRLTSLRVLPVKIVFIYVVFLMLQVKGEQRVVSFAITTAWYTCAEHANHSIVRVFQKKESGI